MADEEHVRDAPCHGVLAQHDEAVVLPGGRRPHSRVRLRRARPPRRAARRPCRDVDGGARGPACGSSCTCQVPAPSPASVEEDEQPAARGAVEHGEILERERDGLREELRIGRAPLRDEAAAFERHRGLLRARRVGPGGSRRSRRAPTSPAPGVHDGGVATGARRRRLRAAWPSRCRRIPRIASVGLRERRRQDLRSRVGRRWALGRGRMRSGPPEESSPLRRCDRSRARAGCARLDGRPAAVGGHVRAQRSPSRFAIEPPGIVKLTGSTFASPWRLSEMRSRSRRRAFACSAFSASGQMPRATSTIAPLSEPPGSLPRGRARRAAQQPIDRLASVPTIEPHRRAAVGRAPRRRRRAPFTPMNGMPSSDVGRAGSGHVERGREDVRVRHGRDRDRIRCGAGRTGGAEPEFVAVVSRCNHRDDTGCGGVVHGLDQRVVRRIDLRTAAGEVDDVHSVLHRGLERSNDLGCVCDVADRRRHGEDAVVAEPRTRRDPLRPVTEDGRSLRAVVPAMPAAIPATCVPWNDEAGSTASRPGSPAFGPGKTRATITFGVVRATPRGNPGDTRSPWDRRTGSTGRCRRRRLRS